MRGQSNPASCGKKRDVLAVMEVISRDNSLLRDSHLTPGKNYDSCLKVFSSPYVLHTLHPAFYQEVLVPLSMKR